MVDQVLAGSWERLITKRAAEQSWDHRFRRTTVLLDGNCFESGTKTDSILAVVQDLAGQTHAFTRDNTDWIPRTELLSVVSLDTTLPDRARLLASVGDYEMYVDDGYVVDGYVVDDRQAPEQIWVAVPFRDEQGERPRIEQWAAAPNAIACSSSAN